MPPDLPGDLDAELLGRYLAGECSESEAAVVRRYLMARPQAARALGQFLAGLDADAVRPQAPNSAASWVALRGRLHAGHDAPSRGAVRPAGGAEAATTALTAGAHSPPSPRRAPRPRVLGGLSAAGGRRRLASTLAIAASVAAVAVTHGGLRLRDRRAGESDAASTSRTYITRSRERAELRLVDGTRVHLAPGSRLRVAADYGGERRDVALEGEGYFDVVHDARRPFTVFAGNASARDLGTAFAVRGYAGDGAVEVVVRSGVVALSGVGLLARGDVGRLAANGGASVRRGVNVDAWLSWLDGRLAYEDAPLGWVLADLARWHEVDVRLLDPALAALPFTGTLDAPDADRAVRLVAATLGLRVRQAGTRYALAATPGRTPRFGAGAPARRPATP